MLSDKSFGFQSPTFAISRKFDDDKKISPNKKLISSNGSICKQTSTAMGSSVAQGHGHCRSNSNKKNTLRRTKSSFVSNSATLNNCLLNSKFNSLNLNSNFTFSVEGSKKTSNNDDDTELQKLLKNDSSDLDCFFQPTPMKGKPFQDSDLDDTPSKRELSSPLQRRPLRNKVRRFKSMYYNNSMNSHNIGDKKSSSTINTPIDEEFMMSEDSYLKNSGLETFYIKDDTIPRINVDSLVGLLDGKFEEFFDKIEIIDCRFEYEYQGGHIDGSQNINSKQQLEETFFSSLGKGGVNDTSSFVENKKTLMVFHCEFSSYRGPFMALHLRKCDRILNKENYPNLYYPNIVVLEGGYKNFFNMFANRCYPQCYVEMNDDKHKIACERELTRFRNDRKKFLTKASSFHFGNITANSSSSDKDASNDKLKLSRTHSSSVSLVFNNHSTNNNTNNHSLQSLTQIKHRRHNTIVTNNIISSFDQSLMCTANSPSGNISPNLSSKAADFQLFSNYSSTLKFKFPRRPSESGSILQKSLGEILQEKKNGSEFDDDDDDEDSSNKLFSKYLEPSDSESDNEITEFHGLGNKSSLSNIDLCFDSPTIRKK